LIVSQKIAAWQTIGRKIAHEVKNPLTPISIAIDDLRQSYRDRPTDYENILEESATTIKGEVNRLKKLIEQFSAFAKMPPPEFVMVESIAFIREAVSLFKDDIADGRLIVENEPGDASLNIDPDQMRQVIINLIKNSFEAGSRNCSFKISSTGDLYHLTVEDDGPGLPDEILEAGPIPYFSTKEDGSGLGLIICQRIVFDHDGTMSFDNKPDGGARVIITLPEKNA
jgi:nitrogen fixation/metabolism regulation signal transduction histidine kinase